MTKITVPPCRGCSCLDHCTAGATMHCWCVQFAISIDSYVKDLLYIYTDKTIEEIEAYLALFIMEHPSFKIAGIEHRN